MRIINTKSFPPTPYKVINIIGVLFVRGERTRLTTVDICHETIHTEQGREMLWLFFYLWYGIEYLIRLFQYDFRQAKAYSNISFEREAYRNGRDPLYLDSRRHFAWWHYLTNKR